MAPRTSGFVQMVSKSDDMFFSEMAESVCESPRLYVITTATL